ncbi:MAG: hypothetical protein EU529_16320 [Promethearchaeota archaeon]|nr:MAG: hypothetical protein EU529_16320 [Candidatus Lokiarchaeota archaeon]
MAPEGSIDEDSSEGGEGTYGDGSSEGGEGIDGDGCDEGHYESLGSSPDPQSSNNSSINSNENSSEQSNENSVDNVSSNENPNENSEDGLEQDFDPNDNSEDDLEQDFNPNDNSEDDLEQDFNPNDNSEDDLEQDFDPNDNSEDDIEQDFDPNDNSEDDLEQDFNPNDNSENDLEQDFDPNDNDQETIIEENIQIGKENIGNEGTTMVLVPPDTSSGQEITSEQEQNIEQEEGTTIIEGEITLTEEDGELPSQEETESAEEPDNEIDKDLDQDFVEILPDGTIPDHSNRSQESFKEELEVYVQHLLQKQEQDREQDIEQDIDQDIDQDIEQDIEQESEQEIEQEIVEELYREQETTEYDIENEIIQETLRETEQEVVEDVIEQVEQEIAQEDEITLIEGECEKVPTEAEFELAEFVEELYREQETTEYAIENEIIQETLRETEQEVVEDVVEQVEKEIAQEEEVTLTEEYGEVPTETEAELVEFVEELYREQETTEQDRENEVIQELMVESDQEIVEKLEQEVIQDVDQEIEIIQEEEQDFEREEAEHKIEQEREQQEVDKEQDESEEKGQSLREQYRQETGRRPIYAGNKTKGFIQWLRNQEKIKIKQESSNKSIKSKKTNEEWKDLLRKWINKTEGISKEDKQELIRIVTQYQQLRRDYKKLHHLIQKYLSKTITKEESEELLALAGKFNKVSKVQKELFKNLQAFRNFYYRNDIYRILSEREKFTNHLAQKLKRLKKEINNSSEMKDGWARTLINHISEATEEEISKEIKNELKTLIESYCKINEALLNNRVSKQEKERILNEILEKLNPIYQQLFNELKKYHIIHERYTKAMLEKSLIMEGKGTAKKLAKKLDSIKNKSKLEEILNEQTSVVQKFKENLKKNLYKSTELSMNEKSKIIKIIQKENINEQDKEELLSILTKLPKEELISLLGGDFIILNNGNMLIKALDIEIKELKKIDRDINQKEERNLMAQELNTPNINIPNFRERVMEHIKEIIHSINCSADQKKQILSKSRDILDGHISRAEQNEFTIPKNANLKIIAWAIIYTFIKTNKDMPKISEKIPRGVYQYYNRYFNQFYPLESVNSFPLKAIGFISKYIYQSLVENNSELFILRKLLDLNNFSTILDSKSKEYISIQRIFSKSRDSLINFFTDFIAVIAKIKEINDSGKNIDISIAKIGGELLENNISMGYSANTFKEHILKVIFDSLLGLKRFSLRRIKQKSKREYQERESKLTLSNKQRTLFNNSILRKYSDDLTQALFLLIKSEFESIYGDISPTHFANLIDFSRSLTLEILNYKIYIVLRLASLHKIEKSILKNSKLLNKNFILSAIQKYLEILGIRYIFLYNIIEIFYQKIGMRINITDLGRIFKFEFGVFLNNKAEKVFLNTILQLTLHIREIKAYNFRNIKLYHQDKLSNEDLTKIKYKIEDLRKTLIKECKRFILKHIYPRSDISEEIDLVIILINFVFIVEEKFISVKFLSETIGLSEDTLTNKLRKSKYFNAIELRTIKKFINKYNRIYPEEVKESNLSLMRYIDFRGVRLVSSAGYLQGWGDLFYEHCYYLILDQLGCDLIDGDLIPIYFSEWLRHHLKFIKNSNELEDIVLTTNGKHTRMYSHPKKPNRRNPDRQSKLLSRNKKLIKELIEGYLNDENTLKNIYAELPSSWKETNKENFIKRLIFLKNEGKNRFIEEYYKDFYKLIKDDFSNKEIFI